MKVDLPMMERRRLEREQQAELRAMRAPRYFAAMQEQLLLDVALLRLELENFQNAALLTKAIFAGMGHSPVEVPAPLVTPETAPIAPPVPAPTAVIRPSAPDDLRQRLGL